MTDDRPVREAARFLVFGAPEIHENDIAEVVETLRSGWWGTGPRVHRFEEAFRNYKGAGHAVAVSSCTAALHLSLLACDFEPGDEVITSPMTFCATVNAILQAGATPVLADIDRATMNMDPVEVERRITPRTRVILPVHFAGRPCDMDALEDIARRHGLDIVEDCAHAIETEYKGRKAGTMGSFGCFSFYVTKNVSTAEGGMIITGDEDAANRIRSLALHGLSKDAWRRFRDKGHEHYSVVGAGFKYNLTDLQAALGIGQLDRVEKNYARRTRLWAFYEESLSGVPVELPPRPEPETRHALHLFTLLVAAERSGIDRSAFIEAMGREGIGTGVQYLAIPEHRYYQDRLGWRPEDWPKAMQIGRQTVSVPMSPRLSDEDAEDVVTAVRKIVGRT